MATCLDLAKAEYPKKINGEDVVPMQEFLLSLSLGVQALLEKTSSIGEHQGNRAIRMGNWKLVAKGSFGAWELFDVDSDRSELNDLADLYPNRVTEMSQKWEEWAIETHVKPWPWKQKKNKSKGKKKK